ncbi:MAG: glycoside hydrolase [Gemmatimonadota bacterium]|nr:glycoside hydrolase [Gemmatimonadota bacterium]
MKTGEKRTGVPRHDRRPGRRRPTPLFTALPVIFGACAAPADETAAPRSSDLTILPVEFERPAGSGEPNLHATADGTALLTWLEPTGDEWSLMLATRREGQWSDPLVVRRSDSFFVNWADFPSSVQMAGGEIAVHWLERVADAPYAYHVMLSVSSDGGATWSEPVRAHDDRSPTEHGFVSMVPWEGGAAITWLDGRAMYDPDSSEPEPAGDGHEAAEGAMSVRFRTLLPDGRLGAEVLLDPRTCECCQTTLTRSSEGLVAAYRDRSEAEVRDIAVVRGLGETWSEPAHVAADDWTIPGCPVNGPQLSARESGVAGAWYTGAGGPHAFAAFSSDGGESFGPPIRIDEGLPIGRVDIEYVDAGSAIVTWVEGGDGGAQVMARRVFDDGSTGAAFTVSETSGERASGFPRMVRIGDDLVVAFTLPGDTGGVRVRSVRLD